MGVVQDPLCIVTEFMQRGSLYHCLHDKTIEMSWTRRLGFALDVAKGMLYLHQAGLMHRDLKSLNVFVDSEWRCKVGDFGMSRSAAADRRMTAMVGTLLWAAPEVLSDDGSYTDSADVYSFGIVL